MKRPRDNENPGPSRVNRPTRSSNNNRGKVGEMSEPSAPVTSSSTSSGTTADTRGEEGEMSSETSSPATSTSASTDTAGAEEAESGPSLRNYEALAFLQLVTDTFKDNKDNYRDFVKLLEGYKTCRIDLPGVITRVEELFEGHPELVLGWFAFLLLREKEAGAFLQLVKYTFNDDEEKYRNFVELFKNYKERTNGRGVIHRRVEELFTGNPKLVLGWFALLRLREHEASAYLQWVKDTLNDDKHKYRAFVELLKGYKTRMIDLPAVITTVKELFKGHPELVPGWFAFLRLRENEALAYLQLVKDTLNYDKDKYRAFVELLEGYKKRRIGLLGVITRVKELFKGHPELVLGWFAFLRLSDAEAIAYLQLVEDTLKDDIEKYRDFLVLAVNYKERKIDTPGVITRVKELFKGQPELVLGFNAFLRKFHPAPR